MNNTNIKKITIVMLFVAIFIMSAAYAVLYQQLMIGGTASVVASWKVEITDIREGKKTGKAYSEDIPTYTAVSATFNAGLVDENDSIEYVITIKNNGELDAKLDSVLFTQIGNEAIMYEMEGVRENDVLKSGDTANVTIRIILGEATSEKPLKKDMMVIFNYVQKI